MSVKEYMRKFEKLLINYDLQEAEDQTIKRSLGELDHGYAHVVKLSNTLPLMRCRAVQRSKTGPDRTGPAWTVDRTCEFPRTVDRTGPPSVRTGTGPGKPGPDRDRTDGGPIRCGKCQIGVWLFFFEFFLCI